ncbi:MAG: hypothetical protein HZB14_06390 [Actinobacteria bacterium]|nr:hypothetical protein [Actinomycetota bacterium]
MSGFHHYRSRPLLRVRAFFLTDRVGHTLASTMGLAKVIWWWALGRLRRLLGRGPEAGSAHGD